MTNAAKYIDTICKELNLRPSQVSATAKLISEGATVPFIARYRKEVTGMLDEVAVTHIREYESLQPHPTSRLPLCDNAQ